MWHYPHSPAALIAGQAAIDRYLLHTGPTAANLQQRVCCCRLTLGQIDGLTNTVPLRKPCSANLYTSTALGLAINGAWEYLLRANGTREPAFLAPQGPSYYKATVGVLQCCVES